MTTAPPLTPAAEPIQPQSKSIAPAWHTVLLLIIVLGISFAGAGRERHVLTHNQRVTMYLLTMTAEWLVVGFVFWGIRRHKAISFRELIGGRWNRFEDLVVDIGVAIGFMLVAMVTLALLGFALGLNKQVGDAQKLAFLAPHGALEIVLWICLSSTAGFCEEVIYRGYLQRQIGAWANLAWVGLVMQGVLFGFSHGYEGPKRMLLIAVFGTMFGVVALWRKSLRPGMFTHAGYDIIAGLALRMIAK